MKPITFNPGQTKRAYIRIVWLSLFVFSLLFSLPGCQGLTETPAAPASNVTPMPTATIIPTSTPTLNTTGPAISPLLVGNNVWMYPDERVWNIAGQAGLRIIRIGGNAFDANMPPKTFLMDWVTHIQAMQAEPMIQVSRYQSPEAAAKLVRYFNLETGKKVTYWNIGNEPKCNKISETAATEVASYIKPIAAAMKAVDPSIKIFAPDECDFYDDYYEALFKGDSSAADLSGKVPGQSYYYVDGVSWHRYIGYPPGNVKIEGLTTAGAKDFLTRIQKTRALVDKANAAQGRVGTEALQWGIGEFNSNDGQKVCSFENGQMFAGVYGSIMKYGGTYGETWSMFENGGNCFGTDFSFVDAKMQPRSTFYHMQMISENLSGYYLDGSSNLESVLAFGAVDPQAEKISIMLLNINAAAPQTCTLRLNSRPIETDGCRVNLPAGLNVDFKQTVGSQTSIVMVFNLQGRLIKTISYAKGENSPNTVTTP